MRKYTVKSVGSGFLTSLKSIISEACLVLSSFVVYNSTPSLGQFKDHHNIVELDS